MSRFFSKRFDTLVPYTPGEQPKDTEYIKLNTNESPFDTSAKAVEYATLAAYTQRLYSDPECTDLVKTAANYFNINEDEILFGNGSDDILNFAMMAFCDEERPAVFPNITYGFYPVIADLHKVPYEEIPLNEDLTINLDDYINCKKTIFLANPNAPTGIALSKEEIENIIITNPNNVVIVDEAYVDFGAESCVGLIKKYDNLLVVQTFSKSRSLAGARLGFAIGNKELIRDLNTFKYSTNPYNVNRMTAAAGIGALEDDAYTENNCAKIINTRTRVMAELRKLGFKMTDSKANFIFCTNPTISGEKLYLELKNRGVLVRHFNKPIIKDFVRITVGTNEQMDILLEKIEEILNTVF